jgi:hypothetical protein
VKAVYLAVFITGMIGLIAMVALGSFHGHGGGARAGHGGHPVGQGHAPALGHGARGGHGQHGHGVPKLTSKGVAKGAAGASRILMFLSPIKFFSVAVGLGATGLLLGSYMTAGPLLLAAIVGGLFFNFALVEPLMGALLRFASNPSEGLEGTVLQEAEALTGFDERGKGLVRLTLDGQHVQLLATLDQLEQDKGIQVRKGEKLIVVDVDAAKNACRVTRELA